MMTASESELHNRFVGNLRILLVKISFRRCEHYHRPIFVRVGLGQHWPLSQTKRSHSGDKPNAAKMWLALLPLVADYAWESCRCRIMVMKE